MRNPRLLLAATMLASLWPAYGWAASYLADGMKAIASGDLRTAQIQLRNAVKDNPKDAEANYQLGIVDLRLGDPSGAEKYAMSAQNLGYDATATSTLAIQGYLAESRYRDLLRDFPAAAGKPETQAAILVGRGQAQLGLNQPEEAEASFAQAARLAPAAPEPLLGEATLAQIRGNVALANQKIEAALAVAPSSPEVLQRRAAVLADAGDRTGALAAADKAVAAAPGQVNYRLSRASLLLTFGQDAAAKADVDAVLASIPNSAQATYQRAVLLTRAKDFKAADAELQKLSDYITRFPSSYLLLAVVKQQIGQNEQALDAATRYVGRYPMDPRGALLLGELDLGAKQFNQAINTLTPFASANTKEVAVYDLLGRALMSVGRAQESAETFQKGLAMSPDNPSLLARLGGVEMALGNAEYGRILLARAVQLVPGNPQTELLLTEAELASGRLEDARASVARLETLKVDPQVTANLTGLLKLASFDLPAAKSAFEAILHDHPDSNAAVLNLARVARMQGNSEESHSLLNRVLQREPADDRAVDDLTAELVTEGKLPDAMAVLQRAHEAAPANVKFLGKLAELYLAAGQPDKALALVDAPDPTTAADAATSSTSASPNVVLPRLLLRGQAQIALKQFDQAADSYRKALIANPNILFARLQLIRILTQANNLAEARTVVQDGLALQPQSYPLMQASVALDQKAGGLDAALAGADRLARITPAASMLRGDLYMEAQRFDDAARAYETALKANAGSTALMIRQSTALGAGGHPDQAAQLVRSWLTQHPGDLEATMALADMDINTKQLGEAKTLLKTVVEKQPANVPALNNLAWVQQQAKDPEARLLAERAYTLSPSAQTADTLGYILATDGGGDSGVSLLRLASAQLPSNGTVRYHLAVALKAAGQPLEATKVLAPLVSATEDFPEKADARKLLTDLTPKK